MISPTKASHTCIFKKLLIHGGWYVYLLIHTVTGCAQSHGQTLIHIEENAATRWWKYAAAMAVKEDEALVKFLQECVKLTLQLMRYQLKSACEVPKSQ